jgi:hypothetical protein
MSQGENRAAAEIALLRKDSDAGGVAMGYDRQGTIIEVKGDDEAPHLKTPPFPSNRDPALDVAELILADYQPSEEIDVEAIHILTIWVDYTAAADGSMLSLLPEVRDTTDTDFVPTSVLDAAITAVTLPGQTPMYGSRTFYQTELRSASLMIGDRLRMPLSFDVGPYKQFRIRAGEIGDQVATGGLLQLSSSRSD